MHMTIVCDMTHDQLIVVQIIVHNRAVLAIEICRLIIITNISKKIKIHVIDMTPL